VALFYWHCALCVLSVVWLISTGVVSNGQIDIPRKKPRKQLLWVIIAILQCVWEVYYYYCSLWL